MSRTAPAMLVAAVFGLAASGQSMAAAPWVGPRPDVIRGPQTWTILVSGDKPNAVARGVSAWEASVRRVVASMDAKGLLGSSAQPGAPGTLPYPGPYYLFVQQPGSTFLEEVRNTMEYELLKRGAVVARSPTGATVINLDIDAIRWGSPDLSPKTELLWRATIIGPDRVAMRSTDLLRISADDIALYQGSTTLAPLASPGVVRLGAAQPLRYAR